MKSKPLTYIILPLIFFLTWYNAWGQFPEELDINNCTDSVKYRIALKIPVKSYNSIRNSRGNKLRFTEVQLHYDGNDIPVKELKIRGKTSLYYPKKSFTLKLKKKIKIQGVNDTASVKDCYLLGLSMDRNYIVNYIAYSMLKSLKLFNLTFSFCEVAINDNSQGIYLLMERPEDYVFHILKSPILIRRGFENKIDKIDVNKDAEEGSTKYFRKKFMQLYALCNKYSGTQLYDSLDNYIDMSQYMQWLAFNYLTRNGDYTDELYLYYDPAKECFGIVPWDYDDLFVLYPHEGKDARSSVKGGQFIFSSEDRLDKIIINDEYLYNKYLKELYFVSEQLNDSVLIKIFQETLCSVYPYYLDSNIMETTQYDQYGTTNIDDLFSNLQQSFRTLRAMRDMVKKEINFNSRLTPSNLQ